MEKYPELKRLLILDYESEGLDALESLISSVFNYTNETIELMNETSDMIEEIVKNINNKKSNFYGEEPLDILVVVYHGLGNSAGWATTYQNMPAILLGVEKIVDLEWNSYMKLEDLISHEYAHLIHIDKIWNLDK